MADARVSDAFRSVGVENGASSPQILRSSLLIQQSHHRCTARSFVAFVCDVVIRSRLYGPMLHKEMPLTDIHVFLLC